MNFDGAENAKAEIFLDAFRFSEIATSASADGGRPLFLALPDTAPHKDIADARKRKSIDPKELIAIGVLGPDGHNRNPDDLTLGIFIQHAKLRDHPIVEKAMRVTMGEARVFFTGPIRRRAAMNVGRSRPLRIGGSVGHHRVTAGTLGCFCRSRTGGGIGILSNNHVLADTNKGSPGDLILQPGQRDGGKKAEKASHVATLFRHVAIDFSAGAVNFTDCAFAYLLDELGYEAREVCDPLDASNSWRIGEVADLILPKAAVQKVGRTTGFTTGAIKAVSVDNVVVQMGSATAWRLARFDRQISIEGLERPFSEGGDSGAMIFTREGDPVGLLFAGTDGSRGAAVGVTYANPIRTVLDALDLDIYTGREDEDHGQSA